MSIEPGVIRKLDESVVNRIAAGEVVQRPANALKELMENCLDAKATQIQVTVKQGGLKLLQIQDNGTGIRKDDLGIVCERFTTSKLKEFTDLQSISTYGFRGEALASITHVARLTITTRTKDDKCAWKLSYCDSIAASVPKPSAGNQGTLICVEDLFYNVPTRRKAFKSHTEEHNKIAEVVSRYAIHNPSVGFTLKKQGESSTELKTAVNSNVVDNIRTVFGPTVARELLPFECADSSLKFSAKGYITNGNYSGKKCLFILFINHRLVESMDLRKAIEAVYTPYLGKGCHPFMYLGIQVAPENIDVNVHPTKCEVQFLHQDSIIDKIQLSVNQALIECNTSRTAATRTLLPGSANFKSATKPISSDEQNDKPIYAHNTVRTDSKEQKLTKYFHLTNSPIPATIPAKDNSTVREKDQDLQNLHNDKINKSDEVDKVVRREIKLSSIKHLQHNINKHCHSQLKEIISNHSFVGCINPELSLLQHSTELYLVKVKSLCKELFYQLIMKNFGNFGLIRLSTPISVTELVLLALEQEECEWTEESGDKSQLASFAVDQLISKASMLNDYFSLDINEEGALCSLPYIIDSYVPCMSGLPMYLLRLATEVEWDSEVGCFEMFARETAYFYANFTVEDTESEDGGENDEHMDVTRGWKWTLEHVLLPAMKLHLRPPQSMSQDTTFLQVASLPELYSVFERC